MTIEVTEHERRMYEALQAISSCPQGCRCCQKHGDQMRLALAEFLNRWRQCETCD